MGEYSKKLVSVNKNREFQYLFRNGETVVTYGFICYYRENRRRMNRCGIMTGKKIGNAVKRNRSRRIIREAFRLIDPELRKATDKRYDFVFVARGKTPTLKSSQIYGLMKTKLLRKLSTNKAPDTNSGEKS